MFHGEHPENVFEASSAIKARPCYAIFSVRHAHEGTLEVHD